MHARPSGSQGAMRGGGSAQSLDEAGAPDDQVIGGTMREGGRKTRPASFPAGASQTTGAGEEWFTLGGILARPRGSRGSTGSAKGRGVATWALETTLWQGVSPWQDTTTSAGGCAALLRGATEEAASEIVVVGTAPAPASASPGPWAKQSSAYHSMTSKPATLGASESTSKWPGGRSDKKGVCRARLARRTA